MNGTDLLADFRGHRSEAAFGELVRRYTNLVYSVAKRRLSNVSLAQEVAQIVFIRLAKSAPKLRDDGQLVAWLHRTTVHVSIDLWRSESRRRIREEHAAAMQLQIADSPAWDDLASVLDEALNELNDADRQAILLRFFEGKAMRDLGAIFGISEDAAKMRVSRAMDRLRSGLGARGISCGTAALGTLLAEKAVEAAPGELVAALAALRFPISAGLGAAAILSFLGQLSKLKLAASLAVILSAGVATWMLLKPRDSADRGSSVSALSQNRLAEATSREGPPSAAPANPDHDGVNEQRAPDPLKLLRAVARARQIGSGSVDLELASEVLQNGHMETNHIRLSALFDGQKIRMEQSGREYRYTAMGDASRAQEARIKAEGLNHAAAVREGLLESFQADYINVYDGRALLSYRDHSAVIDEPGNSATFTFDPRCLGLKAFLWARSTVDTCLGYKDAKSIKLLGQELVEGVPAWHVQVLSKHDEQLDFWLDVIHPTHVLKNVRGSDVVISKYGNAGAIPTEVITAEYRNGAPFVNKRFIQSRAQFDAPVDSASFTLAGLGMKIGTPVTDVRNHRTLGYWTGAGLSEFPPAKGKQTSPAPNLTELMATLENDPASSAGLEAASWILLNTPDGAEVEKAAEVILREHTHHTNLVRLCKELPRARHRCSTNLLETILKENPSADVRATACFSLATMMKDAAKSGQNKKATAEAERLFERVVTEFAHIGPVGDDLVYRAKPELYELRQAIVGKPAPETEGEDLDGQKMSLRDYRGKVIVLMFWTASTASDVVEHCKMLAPTDGKPFALVGVNCDEHLNQATAAAEKYNFTWPSFWDKGDKGERPISAKWNVRSWLTIVVLDAQGVIRYRNLRGQEFKQAVEALLRG